MSNQKAMLTVIAIVATLSVAAIVPAIMNTALAKSDNFDGKGNPHDEPGNPKTGNPHGPGNSGGTGNPHRCPDSQC